MKKHASPRAVGALVVATMSGLVASAAPAAVIWDESINGDLGELYWSTNPQAGDSVINLGTLGFGTHTLVGTNLQQALGGGGFIFEGDAIRFTIPAGFQLQSMVFAHNQSAGLRELLRESAPAATYISRSFPAHSHFSPNYGVWVSNELIGLDTPAGPLASGQYLFSWDNQTFSTTMSYQIDVVVVPTPAGGAILAGALSLAMRRRR